MIEVLAAFRAREGKADALRQATLDVVAPTRAEAGCIRFDVVEDIEEPGMFFIRETWKSDADLAEHFKQDYLVRLVELHKDLLAAPLKLHRLRTWD